MGLIIIVVDAVNSNLTNIYFTFKVMFQEQPKPGEKRTWSQLFLTTSNVFEWVLVRSWGVKTKHGGYSGITVLVYASISGYFFVHILKKNLINPTFNKTTTKKIRYPNKKMIYKL